MEEDLITEETAQEAQEKLLKSKRKNALALFMIFLTTIIISLPQIIELIISEKKPLSEETIFTLCILLLSILISGYFFFSSFLSYVEKLIETK